MKRPPLLLGYLISYSRLIFWRYLRSRRAAERMIIREYHEWSGKTYHPDDLRSLLDDLRGGDR